MDNVPLNSVQDNASTSLVDTVVDLLNQLPLATQRQVLDFVEFLLHRQQTAALGQSAKNELDEDLALWESASDEDWLLVEDQLAIEENG